MTKQAQPQFDRKGLVAAILGKQERLGLHQNAAAEAIGVSQGAMSRLMRHDLNPGLAMVIKITHWLEVSFDRFVKGGNRGGRPKRKDTLAQIEALLLADEGLGASAAAALSRIIQVAYRELQK